MPWAVSTTPLDNLSQLLADLHDLYLPNLWIIGWMKMIAFPWKNAQIWNLYTKYPKGHRHPCSRVSICSALLTSCIWDIQLCLAYFLPTCTMLICSPSPPHPQLFHFALSCSISGDRCSGPDKLGRKQ